MGHRELDVDELLAKWEQVHKKGLLSLWLLLLLHDRRHYAYEVAAAIEELSQGTVQADVNSIYRALNRFEDLGVLRSELKDSDIGPRRRYYELSKKGVALLRQFVQRNIALFGASPVKERIDSVLAARDSGG